MELKQFIKEALLNIVKGVDEANSDSNRFKIIGTRHETSGIEGTYVDFDISIVINESSSGEAGGKIDVAFLNVVSAGVDSKIDQNSAHQNTHRLTFKIFISEKVENACQTS